MSKHPEEREPGVFEPDSRVSYNACRDYVVRRNLTAAIRNPSWSFYWEVYRAGVFEGTERFKWDALALIEKIQQAELRAILGEADAEKDKPHA